MGSLKHDDVKLRGYLTYRHGQSLFKDGVDRRQRPVDWREDGTQGFAVPPRVFVAFGDARRSRLPVGQVHSQQRGGVVRITSRRRPEERLKRPCRLVRLRRRPPPFPHRYGPLMDVVLLVLGLDVPGADGRKERALGRMNQYRLPMPPSPLELHSVRWYSVLGRCVDDDVRALWPVFRISVRLGVGVVASGSTRVHRLGIVYT